VANGGGGHVGEQAIRAGEIIQRWRGFAIRGDGERRIEAITPLVKEAAELALVGTKLRGISITIQDGSATAAVVADKIQIQQVLLNLLRNAAEAVVDQERREIALLTEARDNIVRISIVDNGPGIPEEVQAKLFQPFVSTKKTGIVAASWRRCDLPGLSGRRPEHHLGQGFRRHPCDCPEQHGGGPSEKPPYRHHRAGTRRAERLTMTAGTFPRFGEHHRPNEQVGESQ
jgi:hypothetical protein